jgi:tetratricopeptide (TPR) repeat protein
VWPSCTHSHHLRGSAALTPPAHCVAQAAVTAAKAHHHDEALSLYAQALAHASANHLSHPQLFITHSNKAASHLALGQHENALQHAKRCLELLDDVGASAGLSGPARHPHWPKACLRLGLAFDGLGQHKQVCQWGALGGRLA